MGESLVAFEWGGKRVCMRGHRGCQFVYIREADGGLTVDLSMSVRFKVGTDKKETRKKGGFFTLLQL